eukprot:6192716-Pleurochrysis_carterae.AAC.6
MEPPALWPLTLTRRSAAWAAERPRTRKRQLLDRSPLWDAGSGVFYSPMLCTVVNCLAELGDLIVTYAAISNRRQRSRGTPQRNAAPG